MNQRDAEDLLALIRRFVDVGGRTRLVATDIEALVIECFQDEFWFEDASEALALFVPGGSTPYLDEDELARELAPGAETLASFLRITTNDA